MGFGKQSLGGHRIAPPKYAGRTLEAPEITPPTSAPAVTLASPAPPAAYDASHASEMSQAAGETAAEHIAKTSKNAEALASTGVSSHVDIPGGLAANANAAAGNVVDGAAIVAGPVSGSGGNVASIHDALNSSRRGKRRGEMARWTPLILGGLAIGGLIYVMSQSGSRRSRSE